MKPRVAVLGAGHLGSYHLEKLAMLQDEGKAELVAVVDPDPVARERAACGHGIVAAARLADTDMDLDAVVIATPTESHFELAEEAMSRGCDVLVEKPLAADVATARRLVEVAETQGRILQVGHTERFNPAVAAALPLGSHPRYLVAERLSPFTGRGINDDVIMDLMIHDLDFVAQLMGAEPLEVRAVGVPVLTDQIDMASVRLAFADGVVAQLSCGRVSMEPTRKLRLFTLERYLSIDCLSLEVKSVRREPASGDAAWPQISFEPVEVKATDALLAQDRAFVRCVRERGQPAVDGHAAVRALQLVEAIKAELKVPLPEGIHPARCSA